VRDNHYTKETGKISEQKDFSVPQKSSFLTLFLKYWADAFCSEQVSLPQNGSERNFDSLLLYFFHGTEFRVVFYSAEGFGREFLENASIFVSTERNSELFSLPLLFLFNGTDFRVVFSSAEGFGTEFRVFFVPRNSRNSVGNNHSFRLFRRGIIFLSEIPNPSYGWVLVWDCGDLWLLAIGTCSFCSNTYFRFHLLQPN
jgi:hypothetical protein